MILGISKKVIFTSFLFFNYIQPLDSAYYQKIHSKYNKPTTRLSLLSNTEKKKSQTSSKLFLNSSDEFFSGKNLFKKKAKPVVETKRTYEKIKDHATDISYENELKKETVSETKKENKSELTFGV